MDPELLAKELVDYLWDTNTGKLFDMIEQNGTLVSKSGAKWFVQSLDSHDDKLAKCTNEKFFSLAQKPMKSIEKETRGCISIARHTEVLSYEVGVDFIIKSHGKCGAEHQKILSLTFRHIPTTNKPRYRLLCC